MPIYHLELKQLVDYPRCRIYRDFVRSLTANRNLHSRGGSGLFYFTILCSYANFRSSNRRIEGTSYALMPGEWICRLSEITQKVDMPAGKDPLFHDTWKLLQKYRDVVWSLELSVQHVKKSFEIEFSTSADEFLDSIFMAGLGLEGGRISNHAKCIERSNKMIKMLESAVELLRAKHKNGEACLPSE